MTIPTAKDPHLRKARIAYSGDVEDAKRTIASTLPASYEVIAWNAEYVFISGKDRFGSTLDDYVLPRLATNVLFGEEVDRIFP